MAPFSTTFEPQKSPGEVFKKPQRWFQEHFKQVKTPKEQCHDEVSLRYKLYVIIGHSFCSILRIPMTVINELLWRLWNMKYF